GLRRGPGGPGAGQEAAGRGGLRAVESAQGRAGHPRDRDLSRLRGLRGQRPQTGRGGSHPQADRHRAVAPDGDAPRVPDRGQPHRPGRGRSRRQLLRELLVRVTPELRRLLQRGGRAPDRAAVAGDRHGEAAHPGRADPEEARGGRGASHHGLAHRSLRASPVRAQPDPQPGDLQLLPAARGLAGPVGAAGMRVVFWNIRHGGGVRAAAIARRICLWGADAVALCEFRGTPPSGELARALAQRGLVYQCTTADPARPAVNGLLLASRWPCRRLRLATAPAEPARWLLARIHSPSPLVVGVMHVPNRVSGRKYPYLDAVLETARRAWPGPAVFMGDTNSGRIGLDEEVPAFNRFEDGWMRGLHEAGWIDAFRHLRG